MKRFFGLVVALASLTACAQTSTVEESLPFVELADGSCTSAESRLVQDHITGQINAFSRQDWESAYSYASPGFQKNIGLDQFTFIIGTQYQMLISNDSVAYGDCNIATGKISQEVSVTSENEIYTLDYSLSVLSQKLGIESASVTFSEPQVST